MVEQLPVKQWVAGSNPAPGAKRKRAKRPKCLVNNILE